MKIINKLINCGCNIRYVKNFYEIQNNAGKWLPVKTLNVKWFNSHKKVVKIIQKNNILTFDSSSQYEQKLLFIEETCLTTNYEEIRKIYLKLHFAYKKKGGI